MGFIAEANGTSLVHLSRWNPGWKATDYDQGAPHLRLKLEEQAQIETMAKEVCELRRAGKLNHEQEVEAVLKIMTDFAYKLEKEASQLA